MKDFKPSKAKALINASAQVAYDESSKVIEPLAKIWPQAKAPLWLLRASFGILLAYKQERLNQFTSFLMSNRDVFTDEKLLSPSFQDGLVVFMESYFKLRTDEKLKLAQNIFHDFGKSNDMPLYPLERYDDTLEKISQSGIRLLGFIHAQIPKIKVDYVEAKMWQNGNTTEEISKERWMEIYGNEPLSLFMEEHIKQQASIKLKKYSGKEPLIEEDKIKGELRKGITTAVSELEQLGLASRAYREAGWGPGTYIYNLTDYGTKFTSIIKPNYS